VGALSACAVLVPRQGSACTALVARQCPQPAARQDSAHKWRTSLLRVLCALCALVLLVAAVAATVCGSPAGLIAAGWGALCALVAA